MIGLGCRDDRTALGRATIWCEWGVLFSRLAGRLARAGHARRTGSGRRGWVQGEADVHGQDVSVFGESAPVRNRLGHASTGVVSPAVMRCPCQPPDFFLAAWS